MNPYAYQKRAARVSEMPAKDGQTGQSFWAALLSAKLSSVTALTFVLFAAVSVGSMALLAQAEMTNSAVSLFGSPLKTVAHAQPQVLGTASYGYNQPICYNGNCLNYQLVGYSDEGWKVRIDYQLQQGNTGTIRVNNWPFMNAVSGSGSSHTNYDLLSNQTYNFVLYKKTGSTLAQLTSLSITAPEVPSSSKPVNKCPTVPTKPANGCYYDYSQNVCGNLICPDKTQPQPSYGYQTKDFSQGAKNLVQGWLESVSVASVAPGKVTLNGWVYNNGQEPNVSIKLVNSGTGVAYPAVVSTYNSPRSDVSNYIAKIIGYTPASGKIMFTAQVSNLPAGTYTISASYGGYKSDYGNPFNVNPAIPYSIYISAPPAYGYNNPPSSLSVVSNGAVATPIAVFSGTASQKVASFKLSTNSVSSASIGAITIGATRNTIGSNFSNLKLMVNGTQIGSTQPVVASNGVYVISLSNPIIISANGSVVLDVYVDVSSGVTSANFGVSGQNLVSLNAVAATWILNNSMNTAFTPVAGQALSLNGASGQNVLNTPTLSAASPVSQYVAGGAVDQTIASFNFSASSAVTIQQLTFSVPGSGIVSVSINGQGSVVAGNTATVAGLNITVPAGSSVDIPVKVTYAPVGYSGITSNTSASIVLSSVKYYSSGISQTLSASVSSKIMQIVGSYPSVVLSSASNALASGLVKVASVTVSANPAGNITLTSLPITVSVSSGVTIDTSAPATVVDGLTGQTISNSAKFGNVSGGSLVLLLSGGNIIPAGSSKTYYIFIPIKSLVGSSTLSLNLNSSGSFVFKDITGTILTGVGINNYPTNTVTVVGLSSTVNTAPSFTMPVLSNLVANTPFSFSFSANDQQGGLLTAKVSWGDSLADVLTASSTPSIPAVFSQFKHSYAKAGTYTITVTVSDGSGLSTTKTVAVTVAAPQVTPALSITTTVLPTGQAGTAYSASIVINQANVSSYTVSLTGLPSGVGLPVTGGASPVSSQTTYVQPSASQTLSLAGTPTVAGTYTVVLKVDNKAGLVKTQTYSLVIRPAPQPVRPSPYISFTVNGLGYSEIKAGGQANLQWNVTNADHDKLTYYMETSDPTDPYCNFESSREYAWGDTSTEDVMSGSYNFVPNFFPCSTGTVFHFNIRATQDGVPEYTSRSVILRILPFTPPKQ